MIRVRKQYLVIACTNCSRLLLTTSDKKSRTCAYCGKRVKAEEARVEARSDNPKVARQFLQAAKTRSQSSVSANSETADNVTNPS